MKNIPESVTPGKHHRHSLSTEWGLTPTFISCSVRTKNSVGFLNKNNRVVFLGLTTHRSCLFYPKYSKCHANQTTLTNIYLSHCYSVTYVFQISSWYPGTNSPLNGSSTMWGSVFYISAITSSFLFHTRTLNKLFPNKSVCCHELILIDDAFTVELFYEILSIFNGSPNVS